MNTRLKKFFETAFERQIIYAQKELGCPKPWTNDSQFNTWYFCNVFRKQDKVTKWIIKNIIENYALDDNLWKKIILARRISKIEPMQALLSVNGFDDLAQGQKFLHQYAESGLPISTNAFVIGIPDPTLGTNKIDYTFNLIDFYEEQGLPLLLDDSDSVQEVTEWLQCAPNMGGFMSYEVATDFTYVDRYLHGASDLLTWANPGPGCLRGINLIEHGSADMRMIKAKDALLYMKGYLSAWREYVGLNLEQYACDIQLRTRNLFSPEAYLLPFASVTMREVEHWLCEFDKHERNRANKRTYPL